MEQESFYYATGRRKTSVARTWLKFGTGEIIVNDQKIDAYFPVESSRLLLSQPFVITNTLGRYDVHVKVTGGGLSGQVGAIRHGITRALIEADPDFRGPLKKAGFVKRDPRTRERKKYGQKGARARFQFSKR